VLSDIRDLINADELVLRSLEVLLGFRILHVAERERRA